MLKGSDPMWFRRPKPAAVCLVCGKPIAPTQRRFVDKHRITKEERHKHVTCRNSNADRQ